MEQLDYLVIGHVTCDLTSTGEQVGGTVSFSGRTAQALGCRTAVLTSAAPDYDLSEAMAGMMVHRKPSAATSTFENIYTPDGRIQILHNRAEPLTAVDVPSGWLRTPIVHLAPLTNEVDADLARVFSNSLIGITPQGWMRQWDGNGRIYPREWPEAEKVLPLAAAVILSEEDLPDRDTLDKFLSLSRLLVLTQGYQGCTVYFGDEIRQIAAPQVQEIEPTGAGDVFAAAFLVRLYQTGGNPWEAARYANEFAAYSVTQVGLEAKIEQVSRFASLQV
ncbi:MAG: ribokinase [Ardenticatenaceae bacterium]|nr:ribokinase [Ardenticatenaceae bacterium]MCB9444183.1 ribokinase [Ardenticatenaceae bacterium]